MNDTERKAAHDAVVLLAYLGFIGRREAEDLHKQIDSDKGQGR